MKYEASPGVKQIELILPDAWVPLPEAMVYDGLRSSCEGQI